MWIDKGTVVRIKTTNGGESVVKLLEDFAFSRFAVRVASANYYDGSYNVEFVLLVERLKSIEPLTGPVTIAPEKFIPMLTRD